jgi:hypothetical protein
MGIVPDRAAEIMMAEPAALHRATQRFPGKPAPAGLAARCPARSRAVRKSANPTIGTALN